VDQSGTVRSSIRAKWLSAHCGGRSTFVRVVAQTPQLRELILTTKESLTVGDGPRSSPPWLAALKELRAVDVPLNWASKQPDVASVDARAVVTAIAHGAGKDHRDGRSGSRHCGRAVVKVVYTEALSRFGAEINCRSPGELSWHYSVLRRAGRADIRRALDG